MKMRHAPRCGRHFARSVSQDPPDKTARGGVVTKIASERFQEERNVLPEGIELILEWLARSEQVTADLAVDFNHERRFRFPIGVISSEEVGEQLSIFVNGIDRCAEKSGLTTKPAHGVAVRFPITADNKWLLVAHPVGCPL